MTDHADLIARLSVLSDPDSRDIAAAIEALVNDVRVLKADLDRSEDNVARLIGERDRARHERTAAESSMMEQSLRAEKAEAERDKARALLLEARRYLWDVPGIDVCARIAALGGKT